MAFMWFILSHSELRVSLFAPKHKEKNKILPYNNWTCCLVIYCRFSSIWTLSFIWPRVLPPASQNQAGCGCSFPFGNCSTISQVEIEQWAIEILEKDLRRSIESNIYKWHITHKNKDKLYNVLRKYVCVCCVCIWYLPEQVFFPVSL